MHLRSRHRLLVHVFMVIVLAVCIFTYILQRSHLKNEQRVESLVSRESSFLFNNLVLLAACFVIVWERFTPFSANISRREGDGGRCVVQPLAVPIGLFLLFLRGRAAAALALDVIQEHSPQFCAAGDGALGHGGCLPACRRAAVHDGALDQGHFYALVAFALAAGVLTAVLSEFLRGAGVIAGRADVTILRPCFC